MNTLESTLLLLTPVLLLGGVILSRRVLTAWRPLGKVTMPRSNQGMGKSLPAKRHEIDVGMLCAEIATRLESGASLESAWATSLERIAPGLKQGDIKEFVQDVERRKGLWRYLLRDRKSDNALHRIKQPQETAAALRGMLVATEVSAQVGAPLAQVLNRVADGISDTLEATAKRNAAQVGPRATARLLGVLPLVAMFMASFLGVNVVQFATDGLINALIISFGLALMAGGNLWTARMVKKSAGVLPPGLDPTLAMEIVATCQQNGTSLPTTLTAVATASGEADLGVVARMLLLGASWKEAWGQAEAKWQGLAQILQPSWEHGASPVPLLVRGAVRTRKRQTHEAIEAAEKLGVRLVVPLGICLLPAFFVLGIVPVVVSTVQDLVG